MGRFLNADTFAATGQGLLGNNMFAYCNNNPTNLSDPSGYAAGWSNIVAINDGGCGSAIAHALAQAHAIGYHSEITEGQITIDLDKSISQINYLIYEYGFSLELICSEIALGACARYYDMYGCEFLFSDACATKEIYDHVVAYQWSIGQRFMPNVLGAGFAIKTSSITRVYEATRFTDIRISDAWDAISLKGFQFFISQANIFNYYDGIRAIYVGTPKDPYAYQR